MLKLQVVKGIFSRYTPKRRVTRRGGKIVERCAFLPQLNKDIRRIQWLPLTGHLLCARTERVHGIHGEGAVITTLSTLEEITA